MSGRGDQEIELLRLYYRQGSFGKAYELGFPLLVAESTRSGRDESHYLELFRIVFQAALEFGQQQSLQPLIEGLRATTHPLGFLILGMWELGLAKPPEAQAYFEKGLDLAVKEELHELTCRLLHAQATCELWLGNLTASAAFLEKAQYLAQELGLSEIQCSCLLLQSAILSSSKRISEALEILWKAYEISKKDFYYHLQLNILVRIAKSYEEAGDLHLMKTYAEVALLGLDEKAYPRLFKAAQNMLSAPEAEKMSFDLQINTELLKVKVRNKGTVDFHHQHVLFDLLMLFVTHPGRRFKKEELAGLIWKQIYSPGTHDNLIYVSIKRLRNLLEPNQNAPIYILRDRSGYFIGDKTRVQLNEEKEARL